MRRAQVELHLVYCPECRQHYSCALSRRVYRRLPSPSYGFPELVCEECMRARALACQHGGEPADWRNPERAAR